MPAPGIRPKARIRDLIGWAFLSVAAWSSILALPPTPAAERSSIDDVWSLVHLGRYEDADALCRTTLDELRTELGEDSAAFLACLAALGKIAWHRGEIDQSERHLREALAGQRALHGDGSEPVALTTEHLGLNLGSQGRHEEADSLLARAVSIRRQLSPNSIELASALINHGLLLRELRQFEEAERLLQEELALRRELRGNEHPETAASLDNLALLRSYEGKEEEAEALFREGLRIRRLTLAPTHPELARSLEHLSAFLTRSGRVAEAAAYAEETTEIRLEALGPEHPDYAKSLETLGRLRLRQGREQEAASLLEESLRLRREKFGKDHLVSLSSQTEVAWTWFQAGYHAEAEPLLRDSVQRYRSYPDRKEALARALDQLGTVLTYLGDFAAAEPFLRESLSVRRELAGTHHLEIAGSLHSLGKLRHRQGRLAEADARIREAIQLVQDQLGSESAFEAYLLQDLAIVLWDQKRVDEAEQHLRTALRIRSSQYGPCEQEVLATSQNLGFLLAMTGRPEEAARLIEPGIAATRATLGPRHPYLVPALTVYGLSKMQMGNLSVAEVLLEEACEIFEYARARVSMDQRRATFLGTPYPALAAVRLAREDSEGAWRAAEKEQGRVLLDLLGDSADRVDSDRTPIRAELGRRLSELEERLLQLDRRLLRGSGKVDSLAMQTTRGDVQAQLSAAETEWAELQRQTKDRGLTIPEVSLPKLATSMSPSSILVGWLALDAWHGLRREWAYAIDSTGTVHWTSLTPDSTGVADRVRVRIEAVAELPIRPENDPHLTELAHTLWQQRLAPLGSLLEGPRLLIVIPSGPMLGIPVELLVDDSGRLLGDRFDVVYVPSAALFAHRSSEQAPRRLDASTTALLVGNANYGPGSHESVRGFVRNPALLDQLWDLPFSAKEIAGLAELFPNSVRLEGDAASEYELSRLVESRSINSFDLIHVAAHAVVDHEAPERSALILSQSTEDGIITAADISRTWMLEADLVTLSACRTGLGRPAGGEGFLGLSHAVLQAGARSVVVSLWAADDRATSELMVQFYRELATKEKASALAQAKRWLRSREDERGRKLYAHPYYWAGFVLIGEPR